MVLNEESSKSTKYLPWVEKYRPSTLDDLVSHEDIIRTISKFIRDNQVPHLLFYGPPGTGKTSTILACARQLYTPTQFGSMVLELNASDDRGIGIVRGQVLTFASTRTIFKSGFKLIILDEADAMTMDAQNALRRSLKVWTSDNWLEGSLEGQRAERGSIRTITASAFHFLEVLQQVTGGPDLKTSLIRRFCYDEFTRQYNQTIGADFYIRRLLLPGRQEVSVRVTDIGGSELRGHMLSNYLFSSNMIILVYDITNSLSFDALPTWIETCRRIIENAPICAVIGNKCDLEHQRTVRLDKTQHFVKEYQLTNFLASAKTGESVNSSLMELIARHFKVPLSRIEKEHQEAIVRAELVPPTTAEPVRPNPGAASSNSSVCCVQ